MRGTLIPGWSHLAGLRALAGVSAGQAILSTAFIALFTYRFGYGERLIALHLSTVATLWLIGFSILGIVNRQASLRRRARFLYAGPAIAFAVSVLVYAADFVSNRSWGHNVTYDLALENARRPVVLLSYVPLVADAWTIGTIVVLATLGAVLARPAAVRRAIEAWFGGPPANDGWRPINIAVAGGLLAALAGIANVATAPWYSRDTLMARDPFIGLFVTATNFEFAESRFVIRHRSEGPAARASYHAPATFERRHVILIVADSLRADHMQVYGYDRPTTPFLERLRREGQLKAVRVAMSACAESNCGIASLLSSKTFGSTVPQNFKLHDVLRDRGYQVHFVLSGNHDWFGLHEFYGGSLDSYFDGSDATQFDTTDDRVLFEGLARVPPSQEGQPAFFSFHLMSTHQIGVRQIQHQRFMPAKPHGLPGGDLQSRINSYDNGVVQADAIIAQLFEALEAKGYLKDALIVIAADHGEGLGKPGEEHIGHGPSLGQDALRIPLLVVDTDFSAYHNFEFATQVDVAPTILARLGLPIPSSWEGRSLLEPRGETPSLHYSNFVGRSAFAIVQPRGDSLWKYVQSGEGERLFDLTNDPEERQNAVATVSPDLLTSLRSELLSRVVPYISAHVADAH